MTMRKLLVVIGLVLTGHGISAQSKAYFAAEEQRISRGQEIEKQIDFFISHTLDSYTFDQTVHKDSASYYSRKFATPKSKKNYYNNLLAQKKRFLRQIYFETHPELAEEFKLLNLATIPTDICTNSGFEDTQNPLAGYTFSTYSVATGQHFDDGCQVSVGNQFSAFVPSNTINQNNAVASLVGSGNIGFLTTTCGLSINAVSTGSKAIKLNPTDLAADSGQQTSMSKTITINSSDNINSIGFRFLQFGERVPSGSDYHEGPTFRYRIFNSSNVVVRERCFKLNTDSCLYSTINGITITNGPDGLPGWVCENIDTYGLNGTYRLEFTASDCKQRGHFSTVYIDDICNTPTCSSTFGSITIDSQLQSCPNGPITITGTINRPINHTVNNISINWGAVGGNNYYLTIVPSPTANSYSFTIDPTINFPNPHYGIFAEVTTSFNSTCNGIVRTTAQVNTRRTIVTYVNCCVNNRFIAQGDEGNYEEANNSIVTTATIFTEDEWGDYRFSAGNFVKLSDGFHAVSGSAFRGFIQGCSFTQGPRNRMFEVEDNAAIAAEPLQITVSEITAEPLRLFPNPTTDKVTITSTVKISQVSVATLEGKLIYKQENVNSKQFEVDLSHFQKGIYIAKIYTEDHKSFTANIVKE